MSPVTAATFLLLGYRARRPDMAGPLGGAGLVRLAGGAALAMSWLALVAVSFDVSPRQSTSRGIPAWPRSRSLLLEPCRAPVC